MGLEPHKHGSKAENELWSILQFLPPSYMYVLCMKICISCIGFYITNRAILKMI